MTRLTRTGSILGTHSRLLRAATVTTGALLSATGFSSTIGAILRLVKRTLRASHIGILRCVSRSTLCPTRFTVDRR